METLGEGLSGVLEGKEETSGEAIAVAELPWDSEGIALLAALAERDSLGNGARAGD